MQGDVDGLVNVEIVLGVSRSNAGFIKAKNNNKRGKLTIEVVNLADDFYNKARRDFFIDDLMPRYLQMIRAKFRNNRSMLRTCKLDFEQWLHDSGELAGFARAFGRYYNLGKYGINIPEED